MGIKDDIKGLLRGERKAIWEDLLPKEWFDQPEPSVVAGQFSNAEYGNFIKQINEEGVATNWRALQDSEELRKHIEKCGKVWPKHSQHLLFNHIYFEILDRLPEGVTTEKSAERLIKQLEITQERLVITQRDTSKNKEVINRARTRIEQIKEGFASDPRTPDAPEKKNIVEDPPHKPVKPPEKSKQKLVDKMAEEAIEKVEPKPVKPPEKPKQRLVDKMAEEAEKARKEDETSEGEVQDKSNGVIEFTPLISDASLVKHGCRLIDVKGTTNNKTTINSPMKNTFFLSGSSGDFTSPTVPNLTKNQDLMALIKSEEDGLTRVFVFDGVSQSLQPREWAEALLESALEIGLGIESTKDDVILSEWYNKSVEKWRNWIEQEYESKRERRAYWIEEQRIRDAHSTLTILEIGKESVKIAQVGDSPFFAYNSVNKKSQMVPSNFDHQSGPQTIGTDRLFMSEELSYIELSFEDWDYYIACTDSIGDYLNENLGDIAKSVSFLDSMLGNNPQGILCDMMAKGRGSDGLIEDDLSLFIFTKHSIRGNK